MGSNPSKPAELLSDNKTIMNAILNYMMKDLTIRDFIALSNDAECNKYVMFMANNMHSQFYELKLLPYTNPQGVLMFRKVDDLVKPVSSKDREQRQSLCLVLSYFYTRIFQIYGALAITLIDDANYMQKILSPGIAASKPIPYSSIYKGQFAPGHPGYERKGGAFTDRVVGGADLGLFSVLKDYIINPNTVQFGSNSYKINYNKGDPTVVITFAPKPYDPTTMKSHYGTFTIAYKGAKYKYTLEVVITKNESSYELQFENHVKSIKTTAPTTPETRNITPIEQVKITIPNGDLFAKPTIHGKPIASHFNNVFKTLIESLKVHDYDKGYSRNDDDLRDLSKIPDPPIKELDYKKIYHNLTQFRPQGHCIARAMQLLENVADNKKISHICRIKSFDTKTSRSGLPDKGQPLSTSPGLSALSLLFYDVISIGTPQLNIGATNVHGNGETTMDQYKKFMNMLKQRFEKEDKEFKDETTGEQPLNKITNYRDEYVCKTSGILDSDVTISSRIASSVNDILSKLHKKQEEHAKSCMGIIQQLFEITPDAAGSIQKISLHPYVLKEGFNALDRIGHATRELLISYYSDCEHYYIEGMKEIIVDKMGAQGTSDNVTTTTSAPVATSRLTTNIIRQLEHNATTGVAQNKLRRSQTVRGGVRRKR